MDAQTQTVTEIRISRALLDATIVCPAPLCGYEARCHGYIPGECAIFVCRACETRYFVGLGPNPILRVESIAPAQVAS